MKSIEEKKIIILDGLKFDWTEAEIIQFRRYWNIYSASSKNTVEIIKQIAIDMDQDADDLLLLALDQSIKQKIVNK